MIQRLLNFFKRRPTASAEPVAFFRSTGEPVVLDQKIPRADLDPDAVKILQRLTRFRHTAFLVGGCVRDLLLGLKPKDFDIGTSATPRQIKRLFRNSRIIGRRFRLAHVYFHGGKIIEVATFRALDRDDDASEDSENDSDNDLMIRDDNQFGSPTDDALRRDFTINQLFYDLEKGHVVDHCGGLEDLKKRLVRTIGDPVVRFREDPIRILRAIKFAARLDLSIEAKTLAALRKTKSDIPRAAPPRVLEEINRFCQGGKSHRSFELLFEYGVMEVILPEITKLYGSDDRCRTLLLELLTELDVQTARGNVPQTGEILALLLLPGMRRKIGWSDSGTATQPRDLHVRDYIDEQLRPLAIRLAWCRTTAFDAARCAASCVAPLTRRQYGSLRRSPAR
jgi:poly(A) polymerase